jgi:hypothetical protein
MLLLLDCCTIHNIPTYRRIEINENGNKFDYNKT